MILKNVIILSGDLFTFTNSVDPDEMPHQCDILSGSSLPVKVLGDYKGLSPLLSCLIYR